MQDHMYKVKLNFTKIQFPTKNQCRSTCTKSNSIFQVWLEFDWNTIFNEKPMQERMYNVKLNFLSSLWVWLNFSFQLKNLDREQSIFENGLRKTEPVCKENKFKKSIFWKYLEFDWESIFSCKPSRSRSRNACTKSNSIFWVWLEFDRNSVFN